MDKCDNCGQMSDCKDKCVCGKWGWHNCKDTGILLIRLALALVFIYHGYSKLTNMDSTITFFASLGFPSILAWLVALSEFAGGIAMLLGMFVRYVGFVFAIIMLVAILKVKLSGGFGKYEFELVLLLASLGVSMLGGGKYAVLKDKWCCSNCQTQK